MATRKTEKKDRAQEVSATKCSNESIGTVYLVQLPPHSGMPRGQLFTVITEGDQVVGSQIQQIQGPKAMMATFKDLRTKALKKGYSVVDFVNGYYRYKDAPSEFKLDPLGTVLRIINHDPFQQEDIL